MRTRWNRRVGAWLALMVVCFAEPSVAAQGRVLFSPASQTAAPYDTFEVSITVDSGVRLLQCFDTKVSFVRSSVRILDIREGGLLSNNGTRNTFGLHWKDTLGVYDIFNCIIDSRPGQNYANGPGVLATIRFATDASPCTTPLEFTYVYCQDTLVGDSMAVASTNGIVVVPSCCNCPHQGDLVLNGFIDVNDVLQMIKIAFVNGVDIQDPGCPKTRGDVNNDGVVDVWDVLYIIKTAFANGPNPINPCGP